VFFGKISKEVFLLIQLPVGGRHITNYLARLAQREKGASFTSVAEMEIINDIKERFAAVTTGEINLEFVQLH